MILKSFLFTFVLLLSWSFSIAQTSRIERTVGKTSNSNHPVTAIAIKSKKNQGVEIKVKIDFDTLNIPLDSDAPDFTYFTSFSKKYEGIEVEVLASGEFEINLINSGNAPTISHSKKRHAQEDCSFDFDVILQNEWRMGLTSPSFSRSFTEVNHVIIHHSAGSNSNTNYTQVVRDIYLLHTEVNFWSDIGYNYLIAQNGDVYAGRDPDTGEQDNVRGAHFCGGNTGTMGICLLGNYETASPSDETWSALQQVVSFKIQKESLDPFGFASHSLGSIGAIAGHRDGCSTLCPGEHVYDKISDLKAEVQTLFDECEDEDLLLEFSASNENPNLLQYITFTNESVGYDSYTWLLENADTPEANWETRGVVNWSIPGAHDISLIGKKGETIDTLTKEGLINISGPLFYPNIAERGTSITINKDYDIETIELVTLDGHETSLIELSPSIYQVPDMPAGLYLLRLNPTDSRMIKSKILIK